MHTKYLKIYGFIAAVILSSCGGGGDDSPAEPEVFAPTASTLSLPANDEVCLTGTTINNTQASVAFTWQGATNANGYNVVVKNLTTEQINTFTATAETTTITLTKGEPYSWYVVSTSNTTTETAESDVWKFYLAGDGIVNYAPFMAEAISPEIGETVSASNNKITLHWHGADVDNDIKDYEVFLATTSPPATSIGTTTDAFLESSVSSGTVYYWQVVTTDQENNSSNSQIFEFKVN
ncbi:hypothetical protein AX016_3073 [Cellulophaga sp. RHA19]|uniref:hypothetical protein n=1 Tax=Cellulophaga sp. RHA19 TaxID=1798237 RepID=UPI000C2B97EE|nr:hypothetical protein [Cellulophaga sp. RHA19]PKB44847.1 hypothetical protein AX016_3073 [Cellulophaga sp. RHA19]